MVRQHASQRTSFSVLQQTRNFSLWGSSSSSKPADASPPTPQSDIKITEPSNFEPIRTVKATNNTSDLSSSYESHPPNTIEPVFLENAQNALLEPHTSDVDASPPLEDIPERIGYLNEVCGLDFGYGPSSVMEWVLEHVHIWGGLSWTASIVTLGLLLRGTMFPFMVKSAQQAAIMRMINGPLAPLQEEYKLAARDKDSQRMQKAMIQMRTIRREAGIQYRWLLAPMLIQIPFGFGAWRTLRNCATCPVPGFISESWLWTSDLTFSDPYYLTPAISSVMIYLTMRINTAMNARGGSGAAALATMDMMGLLQKILPALSFVFISFQPGAVQLYFASSSAMGLFTTLILRWSAFRKYFNLPPVSGEQPVPENIAKLQALTTTSTSSSSTEQTQRAFMNTARRRGTVIDATSRTIPTESPNSSQQDISSIDRGVNKVKGWGSEMKKNWKGVTESVVGKSEERQERSKRESAEAREAEIRQQLDERRRRRNEALGGRRER